MDKLKQIIEKLNKSIQIEINPHFESGVPVKDYIEFFFYDDVNDFKNSGMYQKMIDKDSFIIIRLIENSVGANYFFHYDLDLLLEDVLEDIEKVLA